MKAKIINFINEPNFDNAFGDTQVNLRLLPNYVNQTVKMPRAKSNEELLGLLHQSAINASEAWRQETFPDPNLIFKIKEILNSGYNSKMNAFEYMSLMKLVNPLLEDLIDALKHDDKIELVNLHQFMQYQRNPHSEQAFRDFQRRASERPY